MVYYIKRKFAEGDKKLICVLAPRSGIRYDFFEDKSTGSTYGVDRKFFEDSPMFEVSDKPMKVSKKVEKTVDDIEEEIIEVKTVKKRVAKKKK